MVIYFVSQLIGGQRFKNMPDADLGWYMLGAYIFGLFLMTTIMVRRLFLDIQVSNKRMKDPNYQNLMRSLGLLK
jgi:hypothetical protein